jgi:uncharacterized protein (TIGR02722 family)
MVAAVKKLSLFALMTMLVVGCSSKVTRVDPGTTTDLSGMWNDTDSRLVAQAMIKDVLSHPWLPNYTAEKGRIPVVIVGTIVNLSYEHISVQTFVSDLERALINSGRVEVVASRQERGEIRDEREDQDLNAREDTRNEMGQEVGADFMIKGTINTIVDAKGKTAVRYYQIDLTLIRLDDNRKVWIGQKKIKKYITGKKVRL